MMFQAKLVDNTAYYKWRQKQNWLLLLSTFMTGLAVGYFHSSLWIVLLIAGCNLAVLALLYYSKKRIDRSRSNHVVTFNPNNIVIQSTQGEDIESIDLNSIESIYIKDKYAVSNDNALPGLWDRILGKVDEQFIVLQKDGRKRKIDFELDSHYMITQLDALFKSWNSRGFHIKQIKKEF